MLKPCIITAENTIELSRRLQIFLDHHPKSKIMGMAQSESRLSPPKEVVRIITLTIVYESL